MLNLPKLQNGSDIRGITLKKPGGPEVNLTPEIAGKIAAAFAIWLATKQKCANNNLRIGVGTDSRVTAEDLKAGIISGLTCAHVQTFDCGLASTPAMFMSTVFENFSFDGAIMITASHLPMEFNGLKFFTRHGGLDKSDIKEILEVAAGEPHAGLLGGSVTSVNLIDTYAEFLKKRIVEQADNGPQPLKGLHFVVDSGNGSGGFFVSKVLEPLGADCSGSQYLDPDGRFPNHVPNPEDKAAIASIKCAVINNKADLGIIFDTDVDRMAAVFADGREVNREALIVLMAAILSPDWPCGTIVTDSVTSDRLKIFLEKKLNLKHHRFKRGYKNVINEAIRLNEQGIVTPLAIETSGHGALKENYFLDDGAYMAVKLVAALARIGKTGHTLQELISEFPPAEAECEYRIPINDENFIDYGKTILDSLVTIAKQQGIELADTYEGVRFAFPNGWMLIRISLHEPVLIINAEGSGEEVLSTIVNKAWELLARFDKLDISIQNRPIKK